MLDKEVLKNDLYLLTKNFYKVIEVNLDEDTYFEVKVDDAERPHIYNGVRTWVDGFIAGGGVHPDDITRFRKFFNLFDLKNIAASTRRWQRVFYRRMIDGEWKYVYMEVIPMDSFSKNDPIVLIVVKEIADYVRDFCEQVDGAHLDQ